MKTRAHGLRLARLATVVAAVALAGTAACASGGEDPQKEQVRAEQREAAARRAERPSPALAVLEIVRQESFLSIEQEAELDSLAADFEGDREEFYALHEKLRLTAA